MVAISSLVKTGGDAYGNFIVLLHILLLIEIIIIIPITIALIIAIKLFFGK